MPDDSDGNNPTVGLESTTTLLIRVQDGDIKARDQLLARFREPLRRWAHGRVPRGARSLVDTEDVVQNTLIRSLDHLKAFEPRREGAFLAYLRRILMNQIRDEARKAARQPPREEPGEDLPASSPSPLEEALGTEAVARYETALAKLPEDDQQALVLRIELGFTYPQVAQAIGSPSANAARMRVVRALVRLVEELK